MVIAVGVLLIGACTNAPRADSAGAGPSLAGTRWTLQTLGNAAIERTAGISLRFDTDGTFSGSDGCNRYQGNYRAAGGSLTIAGNIAATMMACPDPVEDLARAYLEALQRATRFTVEEDRLRLFDGGNRLLAVLVAAGGSP